MCQTYLSSSHVSSEQKAVVDKFPGGDATFVHLVCPALGEVPGFGSGKEARLCFAGHVLMENRTGLVVDVTLTQATGTAERETALDMLEQVSGAHRITVGADKNYDTYDLVTECREMNVTPHVARRQWSHLDQRTVRHEGHQVSQRVRKRVEEIFGWMKTVGGGRKLRYKGVARNQLWAELTAAAYNLVRMARLAVEMLAIQGRSVPAESE